MIVAWSYGLKVYLRYECIDSERDWLQASFQGLISEGVRHGRSPRPAEASLAGG